MSTSEGEIKITPAKVFKEMVKNRAAMAGINYLKELQKKGSKGSPIS